MRRGEQFRPTGVVVQRVVDEQWGPQGTANVPGACKSMSMLMQAAARMFDESSRAALHHDNSGSCSMRSTSTR